MSSSLARTNAWSRCGGPDRGRSCRPWDLGYIIMALNFRVYRDRKLFTVCEMALNVAVTLEVLDSSSALNLNMTLRMTFNQNRLPPTTTVKNKFWLNRRLLIFFLFSDKITIFFKTFVVNLALNHQHRLLWRFERWQYGIYVSHFLMWQEHLRI